MGLKEASREISRAGKCYHRRNIIQWLTEEFGSLATNRLVASRYVPESQNQDVRPLTRAVALS